MEQHTRWQLSGTFDGFKLQNLEMIMILQTVSLATQFMMQSFKTKRQMSCDPVQGSQCQVSNFVKTLLPVSLGIILHQMTSSKSLINTLYDMNMSISYKKVACIEEKGTR